MADGFTLLEAAFAAGGALATAAATAYAAWAHTRTGRVRKQLRLAENELSSRAEALSFQHYTSAWSDIQNEVLSIFEDTPFDRFLLLRAWNGALDPRWSTAFLQLRSGDQRPFTYTHVDLDSDYRDRLVSTGRHGMVVFRTDELPENSLIGGIYRTEGVKFSIWGHISDYRFDEGSKAIMYFSMASHEDREPTAADIIRVRLIASRLRALAMAEPHSKRVLATA